MPQPSFRHDIAGLVSDERRRFSPTLRVELLCPRAAHLRQLVIVHFDSMIDEQPALLRHSSELSACPSSTPGYQSTRRHIIASSSSMPHALIRHAVAANVHTVDLYARQHYGSHRRQIVAVGRLNSEVLPPV